MLHMILGGARRRSSTTIPPHNHAAAVLDSKRIPLHREDEAGGQHRKLVRISRLFAIAGGALLTCLVCLRIGASVLTVGGISSGVLANRQSAVVFDGRKTVSREVWEAAVGECASPAKGGYVYGTGDAEPAKILRFVHHRSAKVLADRRETGGLGVSCDDRDCGDYPTLEDTVFKVWDAKRDAKVLWYDVKTLEARRDIGEETGWECIFVSNPGRSKPFPPAAPAAEPWDPSKFNFYRAEPLEFMFEYVPSFRSSSESYGRKRHAQELQREGPQRRVQDEVAAPFAPFGAGQAAQSDGWRGHLRGPVSAKGPSPEDMPPSLSVECGDVSDASPPRHAVIVNVRPVGPVSILLTPGYPRSLHQRATPEALAVAMDFSEGFMTTPHFRLGFNSGGSSASVNHLHFQCWYFDAGSRGMPLETAKTVFAAELPLPAEAGSANALLEVHTLEDYPIRALVFHTLGNDLQAVGEVIAECIDQLVEDDTPHTMLFSQGRSFLLPRQPLLEPPFAAVPGFPEVSGEVIITSEADFPTVTADTVFRFWRDKISVGEERFDEIVKACLRL